MNIISTIINRVSAVEKNSKSYAGKYATLHEILLLVNPVLEEHKVHLNWTTKFENEGQIAYFICSLKDENGKLIEETKLLLTKDTFIPLLSSSTIKSGSLLQSIGANLTYLKRYTLLSLLAIPLVEKGERELYLPVAQKEKAKELEKKKADLKKEPTKKAESSTQEKKEVQEKLIEVPVEKIATHWKSICDGILRFPLGEDERRTFSKKIFEIKASHTDKSFTDCELEEIKLLAPALNLKVEYGTSSKLTYISILGKKHSGRFIVPKK